MSKEVFHPEILDYFPDYKYWQPRGDQNVICNMHNPNNMVGHQQHAFSVYWALKQCTLLDLGLDLGSHRGLTPYCIHIDLYYGNGQLHPFYGDVPSYWTSETSADIICDASDLSLFPSNTFPIIISNHSLEHMPGNDNDIIDMLCNQWLRVLRKNGILAMVIPDNDSFDVLASDKDHKNAWSHIDFRNRILDHVILQTGAELVEYDTFKNNFSFNVVLRKQ